MIDFRDDESRRMESMIKHLPTVNVCPVSFDLAAAVSDANAEYFKLHPGVPELRAQHSDYFQANAEAMSRAQLKRLKRDLVTMMKNNGRGKIIGICVDAIKEAEAAGAEW